jgi:hypothetical protein
MLVMEPSHYVLLLGQSLYLDALGASLHDSPNVKILPPGSNIQPDIVMVAYADNPWSEAVEALKRYPQAIIIAVNVETNSLTMLHAAFGPARNSDDLLDAIRRSIDETGHPETPRQP